MSAHQSAFAAGRTTMYCGLAEDMLGLWKLWQPGFSVVALQALFPYCDRRQSPD